MNTRKALILCAVSCLVTLGYFIYSSLSFKLIFCDVGQGAATFLQFGSYQALIDTGPDKRVLSCIGAHVPIFDRTIETIVISHNQKDHIGGLSALQGKYTLEQVFGPLPKPSFLADSQFTEVKNSILIYQNNLHLIIHKASQSSININDSANVVTIKTSHNTVFLSSDINGIQLKRLMPLETTILQVPHHGSKYGLYPDSFDLALPTLAVISVGSHNSYGHPSREALDILKAKNIKTWRTDKQGELVIDL